MVGWKIISTRTADGFYFFLLSLQFLFLINRNVLLRGKCKGNVQIMPRFAGKCVYSKSSRRPFEEYLKGIGNSLGNAQRVLDTFSATFTEQGYTLGNAQKEVETRWAHFPVCFQPTPSASCPPCLPIYQTCCADFYEARQFY